MLSFLVLVLFLQLPFAHAEAWYFDRAINGVEFWKNKTLRTSRIVADARLIPSNRPLAFYQSSLFTTELQQRKMQTLRLFGIHDWSAKIHSSVKLGESIVVDFSGDYYDREKTRVYYLERHIYSKTETRQYLFTTEVSAQLQRDEILKAFDLIDSKILTKANE